MFDARVYGKQYYNKNREKILQRCRERYRKDKKKTGRISKGLRVTRSCISYKTCVLTFD